MKFNVCYALTVLSALPFINVCAKKCCNQDCTTAISMGHATTTFQENYPGFLTYFSGDLVIVLSKEVIEEIEFWEAEIGGKTGYVEAASVEEDSVMCTPAEVNIGISFLPRQRDLKQHGDKLNIFSSKLIFGDHQKDEKAWYSIVWSSLKKEFFQALESVHLLTIDSIIKILIYCAQGNGIHWIIVVSLIWGTLFSNLWLRKVVQQKDIQLMKLVEGAAHINFKNDVLSANMADMTTAAEELEDNLNSLSVEKEDLEQRGITLKNKEANHTWNHSYLQDLIQQLETHTLAVRGENSRLVLGKKHCLKMMADLKLEVGGLRATNDQLESDRNRLETQLNWKGKQLEEAEGTNKDMKRSIALLQDEAGRKYSRVNGKDLENIAKLLKEGLANHAILLNTWMSEVEPKYEVTDLIEGDTQLEGIMETSKAVEQLVEAKCQCEIYKSRLQKTSRQLTTVNNDNGNLEVCLQKIKKELEVCRSSIATEKAKSTILPDFYKDNGLTSTVCIPFNAD